MAGRHRCDAGCPRAVPYCRLNDTAFYPSNVDLQYSLTIRNSSSSETTLRAMAYVSLLIPVIVAYGSYAWWSIDKKKIDRNEIKKSEAY